MQYDMPNQLVTHKEMVQELKAQERLIILSEELIDFDFTEFMTVSGARELEVFNRLPCKMTVIWTIQSENINETTKLTTF